MTGTGLMDFLISIIVLLATGAVFFLVIDRVAPDPILNRIGKIAIGVLLLVVFLLAVKAVLFGGGVQRLAPGGFIWFCIGVLVLLVVLFIIDAILTWIAGAMAISPPIITMVKYVIFGVALIALLIVADKTLLGGGYALRPLSG